MLHSDFLLHKKISHMLRHSSLFAKRHARLTCSLASALTTVRCLYHLFARVLSAQISLYLSFHFVLSFLLHSTKPIGFCGNPIVPCGTVILNFTMFFTKSCKNTCTKNRQTKRFADYIFLFRFHYSLKFQLNVPIIRKKSRLYRLLICKRSHTYFVYS